MKEKDSLEKLKKEYEKLRKKYKLPSFQQLNEEFEIEKFQEKQTDFLLRNIRRTMTDKVAAFLHFFEMFLNPSAAPIFVLAVLKKLTAKDKGVIEGIYNQLVSLELRSLALDMAYDEKKECEFIKKSVKIWQELKPSLQEFSDLLIRIQPKQKEGRKNYFG